MKPTVIGIVGTIRELLGQGLKLLLLVTGLVLAAAVAPIVLVVIPQVLIIQNPEGDFGWLLQLLFWATPFTVAIWMAVLCHWHSLRLWQREGRDLSEWRDSRGGFIAGNLKSTGFLNLGFFGSFACEIFYMLAFRGYEGVAGKMLFFAMFPFAAYAPVLILLHKRRNYSEPPVKRCEGCDEPMDGYPYDAGGRWCGSMCAQKVLHMEKHITRMKQNQSRSEPESNGIS